MKHANLFFPKEMITCGVGLLLALFGGLLLTSNMAAASALTITTTSPCPTGQRTPSTAPRLQPAVGRLRMRGQSPAAVYRAWP